MEKKIFTIGYTGFNIEEFINVLKKNNINAVVDVRSNPFSKYYPDYDTNRLKDKLNEYGIAYRLYDKEFGARQNDYSLYTKENKLDLNLFAKSKQFQLGIKRLKKGIVCGFTIVLMCAEKNPMECHRAVLIGRELSLRGFKVFHIIDSKKVISEKELELLLVNNYFPQKNQLSIFNEDNMSLEEQIRKAVNMQREKIAYHEKEILDEQDIYDRFH